MVKQYWADFQRDTGTTATRYSVVMPGSTPAMADELVALIIAGCKRAMASLLHDYLSSGDAIPAVGDFVVVVDGRGHPKCIWRSTEVQVKPLSQVDVKFAWDEGEGERTRDWWLAAHTNYFRAQADREGFPFDEEIDTVFERVEVVWPLTARDRRI